MYNCNNTNQSPRILPNVYSLRYQYIGNQFKTSLKFAGGTQTGSIVTFVGSSTYGLTVNTDSHMMKNSEWGAVAYLSHSIYGINGEIRSNNNSNYITGCGALSENSVGKSSTCGITYGESSSYPQSTSGNITGVFDMSGGAKEYVMGNYDNTANSTYFPTLPDSKYYDVYLSTQFTGDIETNMSFCTLDTCGGHALHETAGWYNDDAYFASSLQPWYMRGGESGSTGSGVFSCSIDKGESTSATLPVYSWRSVLVVG